MAYTTRALLEAQFGVKNIAEWADLDNDRSPATITARITAAIAYADGYIDDRLRASPYTVPVVDTAGTAAPPTLVDVATRLAAVWLYESRGVQETDPETGRPIHRLYWCKEDAEVKLRAVASGQMRLDSTTADPAIAQAVSE